MLRTDLGTEPVWVGVVSHKREFLAHPDSVTTALLGTVTWYVNHDQVETYLAAGAPYVRPVNDLAHARNAILADAWAQGVPAVQLDDDIKALKYAVEREDSTPELRRYTRAVGSLKLLVEDILACMDQVGARLGGVASSSNLLAYNINTPIRTRNFIIASAMIARPCGLWFDPYMRLKEDYDYTAQHIHKYGCVARSEKWLLEIQHYAKVGGATTYRSDAVEQEAIAYLRAKWGENVFRPHSTRGPNEVKMLWPKYGLDYGAPYLDSPDPHVQPMTPIARDPEQPVTAVQFSGTEAALAAALRAAQGEPPPGSLTQRQLITMRLMDLPDQPKVKVKVNRTPNKTKLPALHSIDFEWPGGSKATHLQMVWTHDGKQLALKAVTTEGKEYVLWAVPYELKDDMDTAWLQFAQSELTPWAVTPKEA